MEGEEPRPESPPPAPRGKRLRAALWYELRTYGALLGGSLATVLVAMYALSSAESAQGLRQGERFEGASLGSEVRADYRSEGSVRTVVIGFQSGFAQALRDVVFTVNSSISSVSSRIVDEVRADDAARAIAQAQRNSSGGFAPGEAPPPVVQVSRTAVPTALAGVGTPRPGGTALPVTALTGTPTAAGLPATVLPTASPPATTAPTSVPSTVSASTPSPTADSQTQSQTTGTQAGPLGGATTVPQAPTTEAAATPPPPTTAPVTATVGVPTVEASPSAEATATVVPVATATPLPPTATSVPPTATSVPPTATPGQDTTGGTPGPTGPTGPTATPLSVPVVDLSLPRPSDSAILPLFSGTLAMRAGETVTRGVQVQNNGSIPFQYSLATSGGTGPLWVDPTDGLQMIVRRNGVAVYSGPLQTGDRVIGQLARGGYDDLVIEVSLPASAGNAFQRLTTTVSFDFTSVSVP